MRKDSDHKTLQRISLFILLLSVTGQFAASAQADALDHPPQEPNRLAYHQLAFQRNDNIHQMAITTGIDRAETTWLWRSLLIDSERPVNYPVWYSQDKLAYLAQRNYGGHLYWDLMRRDMRTNTSEMLARGDWLGSRPAVVPPIKRINRDGLTYLGLPVYSARRFSFLKDGSFAYVALNGLDDVTYYTFWVAEAGKAEGYIYKVGTGTSTNVSSRLGFIEPPGIIPGTIAYIKNDVSEKSWIILNIEDNIGVITFSRNSRGRLEGDYKILVNGDVFTHTFKDVAVSPDGRELTFSAKIGETLPGFPAEHDDFEIYEADIRIDGSGDLSLENIERVTIDKGEDISPAWMDIEGGPNVAGSDIGRDDYLAYSHKPAADGGATVETSSGGNLNYDICLIHAGIGISEPPRSDNEVYGCARQITDDPADDLSASFKPGSEVDPLVEEEPEDGDSSFGTFRYDPPPICCGTIIPREPGPATPAGPASPSASPPPAVESTTAPPTPPAQTSAPATGPKSASCTPAKLKALLRKLKRLRRKVRQSQRLARPASGKRVARARRKLRKHSRHARKIKRKIKLCRRNLRR